MTYSDVVLADSPFAYWKLDETSGTTAADSAGSTPGTYTDNYSLGAGALVAGSAASLGLSRTSPAGRVSFGSVDLSGAAVTVEVWLQTTTSTGESVFTGQQDSASMVQLSLNGAHAAFVIGNGSTAGGVIGTVDIADGATHHVVGVYDGAALAVYVDGALDNSVAMTGSVQASALFSLGRYFRPGSGYTNGFDGTLDEVAVYKTALSSAMIAAHYAAGISAITLTPASDASASVAPKIVLAWTDPDDANVTGVMVRRAEGSTPPATATDGDLVGDVAVGVETVDDATVSADTTYAYSIFAHDGSANYADPATVTETATAVPTPPTTGQIWPRGNQIQGAS